MTKSVIVKSLTSAVRYVGIKEMRERQRNCITLDEVALEASRQLFRYVPFTIEEQVPVFTELGANFGKNSTKLRKNNYLNKRKL